MQRYLALAVFLLVVVGGGILIGFVTLPGEWYASLTKLAFNPPNWIFAPVWTVLYVLIAIAGWRCWERAPSAAPMRIWGAQLVLNFLWSPIFFGAHFMGLALVVILALLASILVFMLASSRHDKIAAWLFAPYAVWVAFAALLNGSLWWLN